MVNDNGLVDEYEKLQKLKEDINKKIEEIKGSIISLAQEKNTEVLFGTHKLCSIKKYDKVVYPEDKSQLINTLKSKGIYDNFLSLNYFKLNPKILKNEIDEEIIKLVKKGEAFRVSLKDIKK